MAKESKRATAAPLDFTNVQDGMMFNKKHYAPGDYPAKVLKVQDAVKKDDKSVKMWLFTIAVKSGTYPYYCNRMAANQLWKIRNLFVACGINVPKKRVNVDPNKLVGRSLAVTLDDEEYEGKMQSVVATTFPLSELENEGDGEEPDEDEEVVEEAPAKQKKAKSGKKAKSVEAPQVNGKKGKKSKPKTVDEVTDDELEELEIEEI